MRERVVRSGTRRGRSSAELAGQPDDPAAEWRSRSNPIRRASLLGLLVGLGGLGCRRAQDSADDEGCPQTCAVDGDGDGYEVAASCPECAPLGDTEDCDDADPLVHPGAPEVCGNGKDDDCAPNPGECRETGSAELVAGERMFPIFPGDLEGIVGRGYMVVGVGEVTGDELPDFVMGGRLYGDGYDEAPVYLVPGQPTPGPGADGALRVVELEVPRHAEAPALGRGDLTGDGRDDIVLTGLRDVVAAVLLAGPMGPTGPAGRVEFAANSFAGPGERAEVDGAILLGSKANRLALSRIDHPNAVHVFEGPFLPGSTVRPQDERLRYVTDAGPSFAYMIGPGSDIEGDGEEELAISMGGPVSACLYPTDVTGVLTREDWSICAPIGADDGSRLVPLDTDGDGREEFLLLPLDAGGWQSELFVLGFGPGGLLERARFDGTPGPYGDPARLTLSGAATPVGDLDGDDAGDVVLHYFHWSGSDQEPGNLAILYGPFDGVIDVREEAAHLTTELDGFGTPHYGWIDGDLGDWKNQHLPFRTIDGVGDFNGDGTPDIAVAHPWLTYPGGAWLVTGLGI